MASAAIAGFFILAIAGGVGFGVASADSSDDLARSGAFGFDEATHIATLATAADADGKVSADMGTSGQQILGNASARDISAGLIMLDKRGTNGQTRDRAQAQAAVGSGSAGDPGGAEGSAGAEGSEGAEGSAGVEGFAGVEGSAGVEGAEGSAGMRGSSQEWAAMQARTSSQAQPSTASSTSAVASAATPAQAQASRQTPAKPQTLTRAQAEAQAHDPNRQPVEVTSNDPELQPAPYEPLEEYDLAVVDWSVGKKAFLDEWTARIDAYLAGTPLDGYGAVFAQAAWDNGIDPRWSPAISNTESGNGTHCFLPNNAWGWGNDSWPDWESAIRAHVEGLATVYGYSLTFDAAQTYCPPNCYHWYNNTLKQMRLI